MGTQIVPSGSFVVGKKSEQSLVAHLGSCVGLTLVDRQSGVGGLHHILLPSPTGADTVFEPATYATTGVPLFLEKICSSGAAEERLEAIIGGGALVGPVSELDMVLNVGGRTAEVVQSFLEREGIMVLRSETGGFFGCKISLDLHSLETRLDPMLQEEGEVDAHHEILSPSEVEEAIRNVQPIPQIALKIIMMIQEDDYDMEDVAREVRQDQVISAKVIRLCNSAMIGLRSGVDSIDRALIALGEKRLLRLVVSATVETMFPESTRGYSLCKGGIFQHALGTALVAGELAAFTGLSRPDLVYTAGLIHDIGMIPLDQYVAASAPFFYRNMKETQRGICELEKERLGVTHPETGALLGEEWELPPNLVDTIRYHHEPAAAEVDLELVTLVYLADLIMSRFRVGQGLVSTDGQALEENLRRVGLRPDQFPELVERIPRNVFQAAHLA